MRITHIDFDKLDETFNVEPAPIEVKADAVEKKIEKIKSGTEDIKKDYEYTRGISIQSSRRVKKLINGILELHKKVRFLEDMKLW